MSSTVAFGDPFVAVDEGDEIPIDDLGRNPQGELGDPPRLIKRREQVPGRQPPNDFGRDSAAGGSNVTIERSVDAFHPIAPLVNRTERQPIISFQATPNAAQTSNVVITDALNRKIANPAAAESTNDGNTTDVSTGILNFKLPTFNVHT